MSWMVLFYFAGGLVGLVYGGDLLVKGASRLATALGVSPMVVGLTVVSFGTSAPELAVSLEAAFRGNADIAVANVVGSNTFNVLVVLGLCSLVAPLRVESAIIRRELPVLIGACVLLYLLSLNGSLGKLEGFILFAGIVLYTFWLVREALQKRADDAVLERESSESYSNLATSKQPKWRFLFLIVLGLGLITVGAEWLVAGAVTVAEHFGVSDAMIGLTIVAAGTSLPEVVASVMATIKGERDIAVGNVIGSGIYNALAIAGLSALIVPNGLSVEQSLIQVDMPIMIVVSLLCFPFFIVGQTLSRSKGTVFLLGYVVYMVFLVNAQRVS
jgi:cation:H+ antiporter